MKDTAPTARTMTSAQEGHCFRQACVRGHDRSRGRRVDASRALAGSDYFSGIRSLGFIETGSGRGLVAGSDEEAVIRVLVGVDDAETACPIRERE